MFIMKYWKRFLIGTQLLERIREARFLFRQLLRIPEEKWPKWNAGVGSGRTMIGRAE